MAVWDTFTLDDELDLLECRLTELSPVVDRFVICESPVVHADGRPKPLHYAQNQARFAPWADQIVHVIAGGMPEGPDPWPRERHQRNAIMAGLRAAAPDDLIMFSDVDEIPTQDAVWAAVSAREPVLFVQHLVFFAVDWLAPWPWEGTCAARLDQIGSIAQMREDRPGWRRLYGGGWHLTWLGGPDGIRRKLANRCHTDETAMIEGHVAAGETWERGLVWTGPQGGPTQCEPVDVDGTWPRWVWERRCPPVWFRPR